MFSYESIVVIDSQFMTDYFVIPDDSFGSANS
jgi:hypothetical protein